jgi:hypothetical protein
MKTDQNLVESEALTDMQRAFAVAYATNGGRGTQAAIAAGYSRATARQIASALLNKEHVQAVVYRESFKRLHQLVPMAIHVLRNVLDESPPKEGQRLPPSRLATAEVKARTALEVIRRAKEAATNTGRRHLHEMTLEELDQLIASIDSRKGVIDVTPAAVVLAPARVPPEASPSA